MPSLEPVPVLLMIRELGIGGSERQMSAIARSLDRTRFRPHVGCFRAYGLRQPELAEAGIPIVQFPVTSFKSPSVVRAALVLDRYIRQHGIQLVHSFDPPTCLFSVPPLWLSRSAVVVSSQRSYRELIPPGQRRLIRLTDKITRAIVVNSAQLRRHMIEDEGVPPARVRLCYNGIDTDAFEAPANRLRPPELAGATLVAGVVCGLRPEKDLGTLIKAFASIRDLQPGLRLVIVGEGPCRDEWMRMSQQLGLTSQVLFVPATPVVMPWLQTIDIFVLPSTSEALSNALMEAMACGCTAIASRTGGNPELVEDGVTGLLFEPRDVEGLAARLKSLVQNRELSAKLSRAGRELINGRFSMRASAECMGSIYTDLLADRD